MTRKADRKAALQRLHAARNGGGGGLDDVDVDNDDVYDVVDEDEYAKLVETRRLS